MWGCECWTIKKTEHWKIDVFKLWYWRRLLRVPWTARRFNHSIIKEISPEYLQEGLLLKLKLQYFGHLIGKAKSLETILMLGKIEGNRRRGHLRMRCLHSITDSMDINLSKLQEIMKDREAWGSVVHEITKSQIQLSHWTLTTTCLIHFQSERHRSVKQLNSSKIKYPSLFVYLE